jgi:mono/diheme cytochrome c family protein
MPRRVTLAAVALLLLATFAGRAQTGADSSATGSALRGAYTSGQAKRGQSIYGKQCTKCHAATAYTGVAFRRVWAGRPAFELWEQIRTTMPQDGPGRLKPEEYADIVAYLLKLNGYPAGETELPATADSLQQVMVERLPPAGP